MQSEQQQRIMGYFIEEAKDHLNTIEQGLLSLQSTMEDTEMLNEVFRAAHSVKGGAAMLGIDSIHQTAHRLEDCFKVLQESPVKVDSELESLFLRVFDTLEALVEQLQAPFGLTDETANSIMSDAEPIFEELNTHLGQLVSKAENSSVVTAEAPQNADRIEQRVPISAKAQPNRDRENKKVLSVTFKRDVLVELREMLQLFKQQDSPEHREALQEHCEHLARLGEQADLPGWGELLETSRIAIAFPQNSYRRLAGIVIKEIKQAQELVVAGRSVEIAPSEQLRSLAAASPAFQAEIPSTQKQEIVLTTDTHFQTESQVPEKTRVDIDTALNAESPTSNLLHSSNTHSREDSKQELNTLDFFETTLEPEQASQTSISNLHAWNTAPSPQLDSGAATYQPSELGEPEVGMAELNSLADIFEGQTPDLDQTWQEEEIINLNDNKLPKETENFFSFDEQGDFSDLISDMDGVEVPTGEASTGDDALSLFDDDSTEDVALHSPESIDSLFGEHHFETTPRTSIDFSDFMVEAEAREPLIGSSHDADDLTSLFGDSFFEENSSAADATDFGLDTDTLPQLNHQDDDLFIPTADIANEPTTAPLTNPDTSDILSENEDFSLLKFTGDENDAFEDSFGLDDFGSDEHRENLASTEELVLDDEANDISFDELALDEYVVGFNVADDGELDLGLESASPAFNSLEATASPEAEASSVRDLQESQPTDQLLDNSVLAAPTHATANTESVTDFDLNATSTSLFDVDQERDGDINDLFGNEAFSLEEASASDTTNASEDLDDLFTSTEDSSALVDQGLDLSFLEAPETVSSSDDLDDLFNVDKDATETSAVDNLLDFEDFGSLQAPTTTQEGDRLPSASQSATQEEAVEEQLFDTSETSSFSWDFDTAAEARDAQAPMFDWDVAESPLAASNGLEALLASETVTDIGKHETSQASLLETDMASTQEPEPMSQATASDFLEWEEADSIEPTENLEDLLGIQGDEVPDVQNWDDVLNVTQDSDSGNVPTSALFEDWEIETVGDALGQEGHTIDSQPLEELAAANQTSLTKPTLAAQTSDEWEGLDHLLGGVEGADQEDDSFLSASNDVPSQAVQVNSIGEFDDLESLLAQGATPAVGEIDSSNQFDDLEAMLAGEATGGNNEFDDLENSTLADFPTSNFADLEAMLGEAPIPATTSELVDVNGFDDLEHLLGEPMPIAASPTPTVANSAPLNAGTTLDEFGDLEQLLEQADKVLGGPPVATPSERNRSITRPRPTARAFEQTMRVPVKHLDSLSNLVGELVVNRNSLEQDQERLRQFLDNLSHQVLALGDVGARMQDLYERSLLESSLLASRQSYRSSFNSDHSSSDNHSGAVEYDPLEMDRFTGFHLLSQEMIELIVRVRESASDIEFLVDETDQVARMLRQVTTQLQEGLTRARMVPFAQTADRLHRSVREISLKLGKEAQLQVEGRETLIDKMILEHLFDPLIHLVNNALTHGIELPEVRKAAGKPPVGRITLRAFHQGNQTLISISDDGAGINPEQVRNKAVEQRLISPAEAKNLSHIDLYDFLFHPGFSTKDKADDFAGRGVGMDVVRTSLSECRGSIHIDSTLGKGTTFTIRLPLTLSICKALCCLSEKARLAFPMDGVEDMMDVPCDRVQINSDGQTAIPWRDTLLPFQPLSELLAYNRQLSRGNVYGGKREDDLISIVVLRGAGDFIAIQVDQVLGEQEIVIKQLEGPAPKPVGIAGATVLGDGRIMPIADVLELIDLSRGRIRKDGGVTLWAREETPVDVPADTIAVKTEPMVLIVDDSITVRELLSMTFSKAGYRVEQARDGQEAWDKLRSGLPCDIVFCDIEMPRMDGLELLSRLQKDDNLRYLPIAMLTSRGADRHRQMAAQQGARGYFTKPYLEEVLLDAAQRMIKGESLLS